ncbi:hypothetical protein DXG01_002400 [Tephrocybe rancida]|nr:hypothetical protein DXG01_002400 [Tephrocybe rancida]
MRTEPSMIIKSSDEDNKFAKAASVAPSVPPPAYTALIPPAPVLNETSIGNPSASTMVPALEPTTKPSNFIYISRGNGAVRGTWLLDPALTIPTVLLPPLSPDETDVTRRNLTLIASNGPINADITLAPNDPSAESTKMSRKRSTIYVKASNGPITMKVHVPHSPRLPFHLKMDASNGPIYLYLPRSFNGLLSIKTSNGNSKFSAQASTHLTTFSDVSDTHKGFIGDYSAIVEGEEWDGDEIVADARNGPVKVYYDDENYDVSGKRLGFFQKLFGS